MVPGLSAKVQLKPRQTRDPASQTNSIHSGSTQVMKHGTEKGLRLVYCYGVCLQYKYSQIPTRQLQKSDL